VKDRNDTLLIVSTDHATGGFDFSYTKRYIPGAMDFPGPVFKGIRLKPT
jgi:alkaline phosphatase